MYTDFDEFFGDRKKALIELLTETMNNLHRWKIPQDKREPFIELGDQIYEFLVKLGAKPVRNVFRHARKSIRVSREAYFQLKEADRLDLLEIPSHWDEKLTTAEAKEDLEEWVREIEYVVGYECVIRTNDGSPIIKALVNNPKF